MNGTFIQAPLFAHRDGNHVLLKLQKQRSTRTMIGKFAALLAHVGLDQFAAHSFEVQLQVRRCDWLGCLEVVRSTVVVRWV